MKRWAARLLVVALLVGAAAIAFKLWRDRQVGTWARTPFGDERSKIVEIPSGTGPRTVASMLEKAGVVSDDERLYRYLRRMDLATELQAGEYEFEGPLTPEDVVDRIVDGRTRQYRVTLPEGLRVDEVLPRLAASELKLDLETLTRLTRDRDWLRELGVPDSPSGVEGFLFPDTYSFARPFDERQVLGKMISRALAEYEHANVNRQPGVTLDLLETMTLASIVEKETGKAEERPRISCVFHNRLRTGMRLQTDPTVLYAMKLLRGRWVNNITRRDLRTKHPYNTYAVKGLPPGPIANPGAAAIRAALDPLDCDDLFFVSRNDGSHIFCPDLKCHQAAVEEWQRRYFRNKRRAR